MKLEGTFIIPERGEVVNPDVSPMTTKLEIDFVASTFSIWLRFTTATNKFDFHLENVEVENLEFQGLESLMSLVCDGLERYKQHLI